MPTLWAIIDHLTHTLVGQLPWGLGLCALFTVLTVFQSQTCTPGRAWWNSRDLWTDLHYFFLAPIFMPYLKLSALMLVAALMHGAMSDAEVTDYLANGRGPVSHWPVVLQVAFYMLGSDFLLYWIHRTFHKRVLWPFHAVHHSSLDVDWTTSYRAHPVNQMLSSGLVTSLMIVAGVPSSIMFALVPFDILSSAFVHANLNWTLGPLRYVLATPVFHRWHHTGVDEGGDSNFASTFSVWDWLFGTFYMPAGVLPQDFGVDDPLFPTDWAGQMIVPFKQVLVRLQPPAPTAPAAKVAPVA